MATHTRDFILGKLPDIGVGEPLLAGFLQRLTFHSTLNLLVDDHLEVIGRVPPGEYWQVLGIEVLDGTAAAGFGQGWKAQQLQLDLMGGRSPIASTADWKPSGAWSELAAPYSTTVWSREWDGVTRVTWGGYEGYHFLLIRPSDPVFAVHAWPEGTTWHLKSYAADSASGAEKGFEVHLVCLRVPLDNRDVEGVRGWQGTARRLLADMQLSNRGLLLRG